MRLSEPFSQVQNLFCVRCCDRVLLPTCRTLMSSSELESMGERVLFGSGSSERTLKVVRSLSLGLGCGREGLLSFTPVKGLSFTRAGTVLLGSSCHKFPLNFRSERGCESRWNLARPD